MHTRHPSKRSDFPGFSKGLLHAFSECAIFIHMVILRKGILMGLLILAKTGFAQLQSVTLKGFLGVQGGEAYTYKLVFTDSAGFIRGHSYTYLYETKEVKATIEGTIDRGQRTLSFREKEIVHNHGFESGTTICLINAVLRYKLNDDGREVYTGAITSSDVTNVYCGQGTVTFPYNEELKTVLSAKPALASAPPVPQTPAARPSKPMRVVYDTAVQKPVSPSAVFASREPEKITAGTEKFIDWRSDTLVILVWDGGQVDGDKISIAYNAKRLADNYLLAREQRKIISFPVPAGLSEIVFTANHEGNQPPMTANVWLIDGDKKHELIVYNHIAQVAKIRLRKVKSK